MKNKHNKKRNTAFVFEALTREATVAIIKGDQERKEKVVSLLKNISLVILFLRKTLNNVLCMKIRT